MNITRSLTYYLSARDQATLTRLLSDGDADTVHLLYAINGLFENRIDESLRHHSCSLEYESEAAIAEALAADEVWLWLNGQEGGKPGYVDELHALQAIGEGAHTIVGAIELLSSRTGQPLRVCLAAVHKAIDERLVWEQSRRHLYLTPLGRELLRRRS